MLNYKGGEENPLCRGLREGAEAGVLLFEVMKSLKTKHGIAVKRGRARHESRLLRIKKGKLQLYPFLLYSKTCLLTDYVFRGTIHTTHRI